MGIRGEAPDAALRVPRIRWAVRAVFMDVKATSSLADLYRREQAAGRCLDADQLATLAVSHLYAIGYRRAPGPDHYRPQAGAPDGAFPADRGGYDGGGAAGR